MANPYRGEIDAVFDGKTYTLCLTLGALAELEQKFQAADLGELTRAFSTGQLSARHLLMVIAAGLRGGGHTFSDSEVAEMRVEGGAAGYARIVADLLRITFQGDGYTTTAAHEPVAGPEANVVPGKGVAPTAHYPDAEMTVHPSQPRNTHATPLPGAI